MNAILFPVALPVAVAASTAYAGALILPWSAALLCSKLKSKILGKQWNPSKTFRDSVFMVYYIGNYIAPLPYFQMWH